MKSSAQDLGYESWIQGSGSVDAARAVRVASGTDAFVSPDNWRPGNYRGTEYPVFTRTLSPGQSDSQTFTVNGPGTWTVSGPLHEADGVPVHVVDELEPEQ